MDFVELVSCGGKVWVRFPGLHPARDMSLNTPLLTANPVKGGNGMPLWSGIVLQRACALVLICLPRLTMSAFYNELLFIQEASKALTNEVDLALIELSKVLGKFRLHTQFGIALVHRHFELADDEQLVDLSNEEITVTSVFKNGLPDSHVVREYDLEVPFTPTIVPTSFIVRNSQLLPYEFTCIPHDKSTSYSHILTRVNGRFRCEWVEILERFGIVDRFGITALGSEKPRFRGEQSNTTIRQSVLRKELEFAENLTPTVWYSAGGKPTVCIACTHNDHSGSD